MAEDRRETQRTIAFWQGRIARFDHLPLRPADRDLADLIGEGGAHRFVIGIDRTRDDHLLLTYGRRFARMLGLPTRPGSNLPLLREIPRRLLPIFARGCRDVARHAPPVRIDGAIRLRDGRRQLYRAVFIPIGTNLVLGAFNSRLTAVERPAALSAIERWAERDAIAAFIRYKGVTRCPTAFAVATHAAITAADREALEGYAVELEQSRRRTLARASMPKQG